MLQPTLRVHSDLPDLDSRCKITPPKKLGSYSIRKTEEGDEYEEGESQLRVLKLPANLNHVSFNLAHGYRRMSEGGPTICARVGAEPGLKHMLQWVLRNQDVLRRNGSLGSTPDLGVDFLTIRGLIGVIMSTPYEYYTGWGIGVTKFRGTHFMYHLMTEQEKQGELNRTENVNTIAYGGLRFETYITEPADHHIDGRRPGSNGHNDYYCVVKAHLGHHSLAYGAEMDCVSERSRAAEPMPRDLIEIKATQSVGNDWRRREKLIRKMIKWWIQCYLTGVETIVCGHRDDDHFVRKIELIDVKDIPKIGRQIWSPKVCLNFLNRFLDFVKRVVTEDDPSVLYELTWEPGMAYVRARRTTVTPDRFVIQRWFVDKM